MRKKRTLHKPVGKKILSLVVDGETEKWYFQLKKSYDKLSTIDIRPDLPVKKKLQEQFEYVKEQANHADKVIWLVDFDTILKENRECKQGEKSKIKEFQQYKSQLEKSENIEVCVNTPCLEFWFLLHFKSTSRFYPSCSRATQDLKKSSNVLSDYKKTEQYYKKRDNDIYKKLMPFLSTARTNARKNGQFDSNNPETGIAEMWKIFDLFDNDYNKQ
ncbi:RloB family protein [Anaerophaga thermohalophila]|uniref:RloB family protein n=1 Tax=Anaerophaga thermohalophila TaxID=177400 RepID=UPI000237BCF6|nr:RloB family protein [Anaerophaga thermohalophila]